MIAAIIPSHNQSKHIEKIIRSYENQTLRPDLLLFVFDRCVDDSVNIVSDIITDLNVQYVIKECGENFSAGMTRDYGLNKLDKKYDVVIFTDGDCYPNETVVEDHFINCTIRSTPIVSCGRRVMQKEDGTDTEDERLNEWANGFSFVDRNHRVLLSTRTTLDSIFTYSCNLAFNYAAIELCRYINDVLSGSKRVFNPEFDGAWGGEDNFISDCIFRTGNYILMSHNRSFVYHSWHPTQPKLDNRFGLWKELSYRLYSEILVGNIKGPITKIERNRFVIEPLRFSGAINNIYSIENNDTGFSNIPDIYFFSRNVMFIRCKEDRPNNASYTEEELIVLYDRSAFRKFYLTSDSVYEDTDFEKYTFKRNKGSCEYCSLNT